MRIGHPKNESFGNGPLIAADNKFINLEQVPQWVEEQKSSLPESLRDQMIVLIRADEMIKMGQIADIQEKLRKSNARKVLYRTNDKKVQM